MDGGSGNEGKRVGKPYLGRLAGSITWGKSGKGPEWVPVLCLSFIIRPLTELRKTGVGGAGLGMSMVLGKVKLSCLWGVYQIATSIWCPRGRFLARNQNPEIMSFWVDEMQSNETVKEGCIEWKKTTNLSQNLETHQYLRGKKNLKFSITVSYFTTKWVTWSNMLWVRGSGTAWLGLLLADLTELQSRCGPGRAGLIWGSAGELP